MCGISMLHVPDACNTALVRCGEGGAPRLTPHSLIVSLLVACFCLLTIQASRVGLLAALQLHPSPRLRLSLVSFAGMAVVQNLSSLCWPLTPAINS